MAYFDVKDHKISGHSPNIIQNRIVQLLKVSFSVVIPSDITYIKDIILYVGQQLSNFYYPLTLIELDIPLVITEALANAIIHGNNSDPSKTVRLSVDATPAIFKCVVTDMGKGFNHFELPPIPVDEDDPPTSGRGISLIKSMMSKVSFNAAGNQIRMVLIVRQLS
jgi:anti-sigma regulatory factor (Ser/Thr protein kinase)